MGLKKLVCKVFRHKFESVRPGLVKCGRCGESWEVATFYAKNQKLYCTRCGKEYEITEKTVDTIVEHRCKL